jgi:hypothetical protein
MVEKKERIEKKFGYSHFLTPHNKSPQPEITTCDLKLG